MKSYRHFYIALARMHLWHQCLAEAIRSTLKGRSCRTLTSHHVFGAKRAAMVKNLVVADNGGSIKHFSSQ